MQTFHVFILFSKPCDNVITERLKIYNLISKCLYCSTKYLSLHKYLNINYYTTLEFKISYLKHLIIATLEYC